MVAQQNNYAGPQQPAVGEKPKPSSYYLPDFDAANFVGRANALAKVRGELLPSPGRFLLSGEPGIGKSTLALRFAWETQNDFQAVVFQPCGRRAVEAIVAELADKLSSQLSQNVSQFPPEQKLRAIKEWLKQVHALLVLDDVWLEDDLEHLAGSLKFQDIVPDSSVSVLFTSRRPALPWVSFTQRLAVDAFSPEEVEEVFRRHLGPETLENHRQALLEFAQSVERLPIAVMVGAQLLENEFGPLSEAARGLALSQLQNQFNDVPGLLRRAIELQGENERRLLTAAAICVQEEFWMPFAGQVAGLDEEAGRKARNNLVNAALLRMVDQERQSFQLHFLIRKQARAMAASISELQHVHANALEELFAQSESRWRDCAMCLAEIVPAVSFLRSQNALDRASELVYRGFATAKGIGELDAALQIEQWDEEYWKAAAGNQRKEGLQASYGNQALVLKAWGKQEEAMALLQKQEVICLELDNKDGLQRSYGNQAGILKAWGKQEEAMALLKKQEAICLELGDKSSLQADYGNQALILQDWGNLEEAMALLQKQEAICLELGDKSSLQANYGNQAGILQDWGKLEEAMALQKKKETICLELGNKESLQRSYGNQAGILQDWGKLEEAMALLKKQEMICLELGYKASLGYCYWHWGSLAREQGQPELARQKLEQALALFTELKMPRQRDGVQADLDQE